MKPGVYLDLDEDIYFGVDALGSSDLKKLLRAPCDWWYSSRHNPHYSEPERGKHLILGRALHALMLEGTQAYEGRFSIEPDPLDYPGALKTTGEIKAFLKTCEIHVPNSLGKAQIIELAKQHGLAGRVWGEIIANHTQDIQLFGKSAITAAQDRALRDMAQLVEDTPTIANGLKTGIPEISVFWYRDDQPDILFRARLDSASTKITLDLKTLSNWKNRSISDMPRRQIEEFEYDIQRRYYDEARQMMRKFIDQDQVFLPHLEVPNGGEQGYTQGLSQIRDDIADKLRAIAASDEWVWVWLFYQMRDDKAGKAPIVIPRWHRPEGTVWDEAAVKIDAGIKHYRDYVARFGLERPWCHIEPALELEDSDLAGLQFKAPF